jgi:hypothetical protein
MDCGAMAVWRHFVMMELMSLSGKRARLVGQSSRVHERVERRLRHDEMDEFSGEAGPASLAGRKRGKFHHLIAAGARGCKFAKYAGGF